MFRLRCIAFGVMAVLAGAVCLAGQQVVTLRDGRTITGEVEHEGKQVIIHVHGVEMVLDQADVVSIKDEPSVAEQYAQRMAKLGKYDVVGRIDLARWAFNQQRYDLAEDAIDQAVALDPKNQNAINFQRVVLAQRRMNARKEFAPPPPATRPVRGKPPSTESFQDNQINQIRQSLLGPNDTQIVLRFQNDVQRRYAKAMDIPWEQFSQRSRLSQALEIIHDPDQSFRREVRVMSDPPQMVAFRLRILPLIVSSCASTGCHGSADSGKFRLLSAVRTPAQLYAQFDELRRYIKTEQSDSHSLFASPDQRMMIDVDDPPRSLLLQYSLPTNLARYPHPQVKNWRPLVVDKTDPRYQDMLQWIESLGNQ